VLLACLGGALGLLLAFWLVDLAGAIKLPMDLPVRVDLQLDYRVLLFTVLLSVFTGILFGLLPALQATKTDLVSALKDEVSLGAWRKSWMKNGLIVFQVALSLVLLIGGALMLRGLQRAHTLDLGFNPQHAIEVTFDLRLQGYDKARGQEFQKQLLERVRAIPEVQAAGLGDLLPVDLHFGRVPVFIEGQTLERASNAPRVLSNRISPGYFAAMGTRLLQGREFTQQDDENAPRVAIVNQTFAQRFWPGADPIGKRFSLYGADEPQMQVVGIAQDGKYAGLNEEPRPFVYRPLWQGRIGSTTLVVRARTEPAKLLAAVRNELQRMDATLPLASARTRIEQLSFPLLPARVAAALLGSFGLLALALAAIGLYGVMSFSVARRTHEIGVRMALGAEARDVLALIIGQGMKLTVLGMGIGLVVSLAVTRLMKSLLYGVSATDPLTFAGIALLLALVALLACWIPARRATKVDPMIALRYE
jgi:predicted permease